MGTVFSRTHIDVSPEFVFDFLVDPARIPEYQVDVTSVKDFIGQLDHVGASYTAVMKILGRPLEGRWEVTRFEKPKYFELKGTSPGGGYATLVNRLEPAGTGTDVTFELTYELPAGFLGTMFDKVFVERTIERDQRHSAESFKAFCEAKIPVPA